LDLTATPDRPAKLREQTVSVVIATFNGRPFIHEQLDSILLQTTPPLEIVICDDGSTDGTPEAVEAFKAASTIPIRLYRNERRLGFSQNFLKAAHLSRGDYIAFCDQDDIWCPQKIERCMSFIAENNVELCAHTARVVDENGRVSSILRQEIKQTGVIPPLSTDPWGVFFGFTQVFHRSVLDLIPDSSRGNDSYSFDNILAHDRWTFFLASHFFRMGVINEPLVDYRQHANNAYGVSHKSFWDRILQKTREGPLRLSQLESLAGHRLRMLEANQSNDGLCSFDKAIARWKSIQYFCKLRVDLYSSRYLVIRIFRLFQGFFLGAYLPYRFRGLGPKRLLEDMSLGLFGAFLRLWARAEMNGEPRVGDKGFKKV